MKTDDDEQSKTRQEDIHKDPEEEKPKQNNQGDSCQMQKRKEGSKGDKRTSLRLNHLLSRW